MGLTKHFALLVVHKSHNEHIENPTLHTTRSSFKHTPPPHEIFWLFTHVSLMFGCITKPHPFWLKMSWWLLCNPLPSSKFKLIDCLDCSQNNARLSTFLSVFRNEEASRDDFIFYSKRLMRILIEHALSHLPFNVGIINKTLANPSDTDWCSVICFVNLCFVVDLCRNMSLLQWKAQFMKEEDLQEEG